MKVYLAGPFIDLKIMPTLAAQIEDAGHTITQRWWEYEGESEHPESTEFLENCAQLDRDGVANCDIVIVWNTAKSEGKAVEQGLAIAWQKPIIMVTPGAKPSSNIFHYLRGNYYHCKTMEEAVKAIKEQYQ